jgi:hypothetical protein
LKRLGAARQCACNLLQACALPSHLFLSRNGRHFLGAYLKEPDDGMWDNARRTLAVAPSLRAPTATEMHSLALFLGVAAMNVRLLIRWQ